MIWGRAARQIAPPAFTIVLLVVAWQAAVVVFSLPRYLLPSPLDVGSAFVQEHASLTANAQVTILEAIIAFSLSVLVGIPLGLVGAQSRAFRATIYPLIVGTQAFPKLAIAPLFTVWFGTGIEPKVAIAFLVAFFPVVINTQVGIASIDRDTLQLARSIGLGRWGTFYKIQLPHAAPSIFSGLKVASTFAVIGAVVGEFVGAGTGLGHRTLSAAALLQTPVLFAALVALTIIGLVAYGLVNVAERVTIPWYQDRGGARQAWTL